MSQTNGKVVTDVDDGVGLITFNQPDRNNAMSLAMWEALGDALDRLAADGGVRVVVLTGAGTRAFISGADLREVERQSGSAEARRHYDELARGGWRKLAVFPKPIIARIRGECLGWGLGIAMEADLRIAGEDSEFGIRAPRLGYAYDFDSVRRLVELVGPAHARFLLYTGNRIESREAERIGLVNRVVRDEDLSDVVVDLARTIADNAPLSIRAAREAVNQVLRDPAARDTEAVERAVAACFNSADYAEGRAAFLAGRAPRFRGK